MIYSGLVALYIRPGNGAGLFLQPGARTGRLTLQKRATPRMGLHAESGRCRSKLIGIGRGSQKNFGTNLRIGLWLGCWTCDQQVARAFAPWPPSCRVQPLALGQIMA